jgi:hypothetical protein
MLDWATLELEGGREAGTFCEELRGYDKRVELVKMNVQFSCFENRKRKNYAQKQKPSVIDVGNVMPPET